MVDGACGKDVMFLQKEKKFTTWICTVKILALLPHKLCVSLVTTSKYNPCGEIFVSLLPKYGSNRNRYGRSGFVLAQSDHIWKPKLQGLDNMYIFIPSLDFVFTELSSKARCEVYL